MYEQYMNLIRDVIDIPIPEQLKKQFKIKGEFLDHRKKQFEKVQKDFLEDEKLRAKRKWDNQFKMFYIWFLCKYFQKQQVEVVNPNQDEWLYFEQVLKLDNKILKSRWITLINPQSKSTNWLIEEDEFIKSQMERQKDKHIWTQIAVQLYERKLHDHIRTPKQIRERWMNYLNPNLKKVQWLLKEDLIILNHVVQNGKKWSFISQQLEGRTENQVKNRYKSLMHKICKNNEKDESEQAEEFEKEMIKQYIRKNQSQADQNKQGMVGRRGRHKKQAKNKKVKIEKQDVQQVEIQDKRQEETLKNQQMQYLKTEEIKPTTPMMLFYNQIQSPFMKMASPGFEEMPFDQLQGGGSNQQIPNIFNLLRIPQNSPYYGFTSIMPSPYQDNNQFAMSEEGGGGSQQNILATTPFLNLQQMSNSQQQTQRQKEMDFLNQENPIKNWNSRRNLNQK
ncbi:hypothetical protein pb186bvf_010516 [Paramecium bursaria]